MLRIFCLVYLMSIASAVAQDMSGEYAVQHFTDENGLPQNSVKGIAEDHAGFIWLCTEAGLVRFDGRKFYTYDKSNSELKSVRFFGIQPDIEKKSGKMFATADTWQNMQIREGGAQPDSAYFNNSLRKVPYSMAGLSISHISSGAPNSILAQNDSITKYYIILNATEVGSFYIIKHKQIQYFRNWKLAWAQSFDRESLQSFFTLNGRLYYLDSGGRILQFKVGGFDIIKLSGDINQDPLYSGKNGEYRLYWNNISDQAFVWFHDKLYLLDPNARGEMNTELILKGFDFINSNIEKIHYNKRFRRLFLGSTTSGFFTVRPKEFQALRFSERDGENVFYAQALYSRNSVLTANGIVLGMDSIMGKNSIHTGLIQYMHNRQGHDRRGMFVDCEGRIWTKAARALLLYSPDGRKVIRSWAFGEEIQSMYQGLNGRIWLGMKRGGLYYLSSSGLENPKKFPVKSVKFISFILQPSPTDLWVGSEFGLYRVNLSRPKIELISGTEKLHVRSIYISPSSPDQVFFTTYEHGIFLYAGSGLIQFPLDYNRYLAAAHCIVEDKKGFFWIPTNRGLFEVAKGDLLSYAALPEKERINAKGPFYLYYSKENGFNSNEFNGGCQPCMLRLPSGKVSLPSMNGLVWFVPENITPELPAAGIFIDKVEASGQELAVVHDAVVFPAAPKNIRIGFSSPFFGHAQNLHLSYALVEGENSPGRGDWQEVDNQNLIVSFSSLSSGRHTLFIRKSGGFGPGNITLKKIRLTVLPLWYETIWARFAFILVAGAAIFFYTRLRTAYLQRKNIELEEKVNSRTEELEEVLASLQHSETELYKQLHIRTRLVASISHDINSPMRYMEIAARDLEKMIAEKNYIKAAATSREVALALSNTRRLLENMLTYIKTQVEGQDIKFDQVLVKSIIQEKMELFSQMAKRQDNKFVAKMDAGLAVYTSRQLYSIIIHNLIDNANKYTFEGTIQIYTDADERGTHLIIADTGPGLPTYLLEWLNSPHTLETMERAMLYADRQHGLGLIIVKEIAAMLSMEIFAENVNGTRIHVISKGECGV